MRGADRPSSQIRRGSSRTSAATTSSGAPIAQRHVGDLARQPLGPQVDPAERRPARPTSTQNASGSATALEVHAPSRRTAPHVTSSSTSGSMPMLVRQRRHLPPSTNQLKTGTRSRGPRRRPQLPQADPGATIDAATRHTIDHHGEERPDQQPEHGRDDDQRTVIRHQHPIAGEPLTRDRRSAPCRGELPCSNPDPMLVTLLQATVSCRRQRPPPHRRPPADGAPRRHAGAVRGRRRCSTPADTERMVCRCSTTRRRDELDEQLPGRLLVRHPRRRPLPRQRLPASATRYALALRVMPVPRALARGARRPWAMHRRCSNRPYGLVLVVGPTGSGKRPRSRR